MGQQQLLLIILGVIIVGIAIAVGLSLFSSQSVQANKDAIINDLNNLAAYAYQYKIRPTTMGGGGGTYNNFQLPKKMTENENAIYSIQGSPGQSMITFIASSKMYTGATVIASIDANGRLTGFSFSGDFALQD
ncbi:MAG: hypothetical protein N3A63_03655 [Bacteroidetes bacterium]|nr:hypothetical protein [Bacteroidota bacterium]